MRRSHASMTGYPLEGTHQTVAFSTTPAVTANAVGDQTYWVVLYADQDCHIQLGQDPEATTADFFLPAGNLVMMTIRPGQKVGVLQASAGGVLHVTEMDH